MELKVLCVGDVVGGPGMERIRRSLRYLKRQTGAHFVIVNGENASVVGITPDQAEDILDAGADVITLGNHSYSKREIVPYLEECDYILVVLSNDWSSKDRAIERIRSISAEVYEFLN